MIILKILYRINCILKLFFLKVIYQKKLVYGKNFNFRKHFSLIIDGDRANVIIGKNVFFNNFCTVAAMEKITIGDNTIFGENVKIYDHNHNYTDSMAPIKSQGFSKDAIIIGENCWIGSNVMILKGVKIGKNSVIGAGCVIYKDVSDNSVIVNKQELLNISKR